MFVMHGDDEGIWRNAPPLEHVLAMFVSRVTKLWITTEFVTELPPLIFGLKYLTYLSIPINGITYISPDISRLTNMENLVLNHNYIAYLPPELAHLKHLQAISLRDNPLVDVPTRYRDNKQVIIAHCRCRGFQRWLAQYLFLAVNCPQVVVATLHIIIGGIFDERIFSNSGRN
jgi:hypothetical protein